ncbi:uncharacterized protein ACA1_051220, partial [Acanthamoeba castellanii str. Neff]
ASVDPPRRFYRNLDQQAIKFGLSRPDLLRVVAASSKSTPSSSSSPSSSKRSLVIIDAKSSAKTKFSQQVQVAFYALLLQALIDEEQIDDLEIGAEGGIWLKNQPAPEWFKLAPIVSIVEDFMFRSTPLAFSPLEQLLRVPRSQAKWQMTSVCESPSRCSYFDVCHTQTVEEKKLSQVAYLGRSDHAFLLNLRDKLIQY